MNILLVGGFFGSGKTTVISRLTDQMLAAGQSLCIIENEIGKNSIDDLLLQRGSVEISTITGGCVCCQVTGSLIEAVQDLNRQFSPDWIIVELTGIAYLKDLRKKLEKYLPDHPAIISLSVVDAARWSELLKAASIIMENQISGGDIIVINKVDLHPETQKICEDIQEIDTPHRILSLCALSGSCPELLDALEQEVTTHHE